MSRASWVLTFAAFLLAWPARAGEPTPKTGPANPAQREWAEKVATGLRIRLEKAESLKVTAREERKIASVEGLHLDYLGVGLYVWRARFASAAEAKEYLASSFFTPGGAHAGRQCPADPRWVSEVQTCKGVEGNRWTEKDHPALFEKIDRIWPPGSPLPADFGEQLEAGAPRFPPKAEPRATTIPAVLGWEGERVVMPGLIVERRRCADAGAADTLLGYHTDAIPDARTIGDQRGAELLIVRGPWIDDPRAAAGVIDLAWKSGAEAAPRAALGVLSPAKDGTIDELSGVTFHAGGSLYGAGRNVIKAARENGGDQKLEGDVRWKFQDPGVRNHVIVRTKDTMWAEARVTSASMFVVIGKTEPGWKREKEYLMALLAGLKVELPQASPGFVELVGEGQ